MNQNQIQEIQETIGYQFKNIDLLIQAFTRRSFAKENNCEDNEVFEFIGDKVLDLIVVKFLAETYGGEASEYTDYDEEDPDEFLSEYDEGTLSEMKSQLVQKKMLAHRIELLELSKYLRMGKGDKAKRADHQDSVKEDLFEAIVGAVAIDCGWDMPIIEKVVDKMLDPEAEHENDDDDYVNFIGLVQNWSLDDCGELPRYDIFEMPKGPYHLGGISSGIPVAGFTSLVQQYKSPTQYNCHLTIPSIEKRFGGFGYSEREARRMAARNAYEYLEENGYITTIRDEIENPNFDDSIGQLEILSRRGYFPIPTYDFAEAHDENGNPIWNCKCKIKGVKHITKGESTSKKDAKKQAAFDMLEYVLEEGE
ncbi:MAG: hypothetical protein K5669_11305 [Lachnospiraceae bacterium]|nr:hypothetical protein [Lachnospiraceae bacterium]